MARARISTSEAVKQLAWFFQRNGYVRLHDPKTLSERGWDGYRKGDEVRLVAESRAELATIRRLLRAAGFKAGRPFAKGRQFRQPIYGRTEVERFLEAVVEKLRA